MNIRFLETVLWLSELRSFRATADRMNITPAAISNRVSAMEQELGIRLFERDTRDVRLTEEGRSFVAGARDIVARYNRLVNDIAPPEGLEGIVRIGLVPSMALTILPGIMETLKKRYPRVRVSVTTDSSKMILSKLDTRELDIVLGFHGPRTSRYRITNLCTLGMFWIADQSFPSDEEPVSRADLMHHPIISYEIGTQAHQRLVEYMPTNCFEEKVVHYSNSLATTINMVSAGIGISVLPPIVIQNELRMGTLKVLNVRQSFPPSDYFAIYLEDTSSRLSPLIASIAADAASAFCALYDNALAFQR
ncbi:LysR family transcriptional regulator [Tianweitania sp. BSSL-BM11]|uniref:LysR family transcriptional regulator n=1 Tax=Tianweitania aestuarii TaxID=2814886 RepID=A0ABS5RVX4_9HYPH|nr:LysR family transcriptional regulator [Tianweitania aestuarii]MBS9721221.1 LysR family transcriptional regulator [Tianweitania aestuarii]